jgi:NAD(P)-dependent dehydrogenase (short-subunit alcohol dehydrogenase family)
MSVLSFQGEFQILTQCACDGCNTVKPNAHLLLYFSFFKTECHPHTNMAKAALNMLTRTSSQDLFDKHRILMNAVDTGWINDENPLEKASRIAKNNQFQTPIDEIDAAARILDPIFSDVNSDGNHDKMYGKFLKDYRESEW